MWKQEVETGKKRNMPICPNCNSPLEELEERGTATYTSWYASSKYYELDGYEFKLKDSQDHDLIDNDYIEWDHEEWTCPYCNEAIPFEVIRDYL